jgi:hypothetical protein
MVQGYAFAGTRDDDLPLMWNTGSGQLVVIHDLLATGTITKS